MWPMVSWPATSEQLDLHESDEMRDDRAYLEQRRAELLAEGFQADVVLECGEPVDHILATAERVGCDLIAMSTHGHRLLSDLILGSVANEVRHRTDIPVLLIRAKISGPDRASDPVDRLVEHRHFLISLARGHAEYMVRKVQQLARSRSSESA